MNIVDIFTITVTGIICGCTIGFLHKTLASKKDYSKTQLIKRNRKSIKYGLYSGLLTIGFILIFNY